jgi:hypothetical protein
MFCADIGIPMRRPRSLFVAALWNVSGGSVPRRYPVAEHPRDTKRLWRVPPSRLLFGTLMIAATFVIAQAIRTAQREHQVWNAFATLHHCKAFGYAKGAANRLTLPDRLIPPDGRLEYRCDDHLSYRR